MHTNFLCPDFWAEAMTFKFVTNSYNFWPKKRNFDILPILCVPHRNIFIDLIYNTLPSHTISAVKWIANILWFQDKHSYIISVMLWLFASSRAVKFSINLEHFIIIRKFIAWKRTKTCRFRCECVCVRVQEKLHVVKLLPNKVKCDCKMKEL